jgi:hypothetical protein
MLESNPSLMLLLMLPLCHSIGLFLPSTRNAPALAMSFRQSTASLLLDPKLPKFVKQVAAELDHQLQQQAQENKTKNVQNTNRSLLPWTSTDRGDNLRA